MKPSALDGAEQEWRTSMLERLGETKSPASCVPMPLVGTSHRESVHDVDSERFHL